MFCYGKGVMDYGIMELWRMRILQCGGCKNKKEGAWAQKYARNTCACERKVVLLHAFSRYTHGD